MGHSDQKLAIFRGLLKFKSNVQKIWGVLIFLSIVTTIEVVLGIIKPEFLLKPFLRMKLLNWIFLILTIVKAYYIAWDFMHWSPWDSTVIMLPRHTDADFEP